MIEVRRAVTDDAWELVRLRSVMLTARLGREPEPGPWQDVAVRNLRRLLAHPDGSTAAFVVDRPDRPGELAACAVGVIECRLGSPDNPLGEVGYVFNVATDPGYRRRGYSRACMEALLDWYRQRGVPQIDLQASTEGQPLYQALGFLPTLSRSMRLIMPPAEPARGTPAAPLTIPTPPTGPAAARPIRDPAAVTPARSGRG